MTGADVSFSGDSAFAYAENGGTVVCDPADFVNIGNTVYIPAAASVDGGSLHVRRGHHRDDRLGRPGRQPTDHPRFSYL